MDRHEESQIIDPLMVNRICPFLLLIIGDGDWVELQNPTVKTSKVPFNVRHNLQVNHRCYCGWLRSPAPSTPPKRWLTVKRVASCATGQGDQPK